MCGKTGHFKDECLFIQCRFCKLLSHRVAKCHVAPKRQEIGKEAGSHSDKMALVKEGTTSKKVTGGRPQTSGEEEKKHNGCKKVRDDLLAKGTTCRTKAGNIYPHV